MPKKSEKSRKSRSVRSKSKISSNEKVLPNLDSVKLSLEKDSYALKLSRLGTLLISSMKKQWRVERGIENNFNVLNMKSDLLLEALKTVLEKKYQTETSHENHLLQLENRVSQLNYALNKLILKCAAYENGLKDILCSENLTYIKDKIMTLQIIAGESYHQIEANGVNKNPNVEFSIEGVTSRVDDHAERIIENQQKLNLIPSERKLKGSTHLKDLNPDVKIFLMKELNIQKSSGNDWRLLLALTGLDCKLIEEWKNMELTNPAGHVLNLWMVDNKEATVQTLFSLLKSPAMRCTALCKVISQFYEVL